MSCAPIPDKARYKDSLSWIDGRQEQMVAQVKSWSKVNSGSTNLEGLAQMGTLIQKAFSELGGAMEVIALPPSTRITERGEEVSFPLGPVYRFWKRPDAKRRVLLTGHLDTVFPADDPFQTHRMLDGHTLNGPGWPI